MFHSNNYFSITDWIHDETFDPCMLPMGELAYHLAIKPVSAISIEGDGLGLREGLPLNLKMDHPYNVLPKHQQWALVYEHVYMLDPNVSFMTILAAGRDPLMLLGDCLLRHVDDLLDHRVCLAVKYPP